MVRTVSALKLRRTVLAKLLLSQPASWRAETSNCTSLIRLPPVRILLRTSLRRATWVGTIWDPNHRRSQIKPTNALGPARHSASGHHFYSDRGAHPFGGALRAFCLASGTASIPRFACPYTRLSLRRGDGDG